MRQPLREKLQNAINRAIQPEDEWGALIVGGRRRIRKKKVKNKNNGTKNKKATKKSGGKSRKITDLLNHRDDSSGSESEPLIEEECEEEVVQQGEEAQADDSENLGPEGDNETMPFGLGKKKDPEKEKEKKKEKAEKKEKKEREKKEKKEKKDKKKKNEDAENEANAAAEEENKPIVEGGVDGEEEEEIPVFKEGMTLAAMAKTIPKKVELRKDSEDEASDGGFTPARFLPKPPPLGKTPEEQEKTDPEKVVGNGQGNVKQFEVKDGISKNENTPLISDDPDGKESKLQDQQPGLLCCTIL